MSTIAYGILLLVIALAAIASFIGAVKLYKYAKKEQEEPLYVFSFFLLIIGLLFVAMFFSCPIWS